MTWTFISYSTVQGIIHFNSILLAFHPFPRETVKQIYLYFLIFTLHCHFIKWQKTALFPLLLDSGFAWKSNFLGAVLFSVNHFLDVNFTKLALPSPTLLQLALRSVSMFANLKWAFSKRTSLRYSASETLACAWKPGQFQSWLTISGFPNDGSLLIWFCYSHPQFHD